MTVTHSSDTQFSLPKFNINGTSPLTIENEFNSVMVALRKAEQLLIQSTVHPRDFQCQTYDKYLLAKQQKLEMLERLSEVHSYCECWYWAAVDALNS